MPSALIIPGVQVQTAFEPAPVLPGATGILGVVGVTDRGPVTPTLVGSYGEFIDIFGPASRFTMPEVRTALANGVSQVVAARTEPGVGKKAFLDLEDEDGEKVIRLEARAEGRWGNNIGVRVTQVRTLSGRGVKYVNLEVTYNGEVVENHDNLVTDESSPDYFFDRINSRSRLLVAIDPLFEKGLPKEIDRTPLTEADARAAATNLKAGASDVIRAEAKRAGKNGNTLAVRVSDGRAGLLLLGAGDAPSVDISAREPGTAGANIKVGVQTDAQNRVSLNIVVPSKPLRTVGPFATVEEIVTGLFDDTDVAADPRGTALPANLTSSALKRRVTIEVLGEGRDTATYADLPTPEAVEAVNDPVVRLTRVQGATKLPDTNQGVALAGGRNKGSALSLGGADDGEPLLELAPVSGSDRQLSIRITRGISTLDSTTPVINLSIFSGDEEVETYNNLTLDPDDTNYLPHVLQGSHNIRAFDLFVRSRTTSLPRGMSRAALLREGASPSVSDYQTALERLESAEEVDLVIASVNNQLDDASIRAVHQAVVAHCTKMADVARNRIGIGSVTSAETGTVEAMLDHANDVRSEYFILAAPTDMEGAVAGLLGRQNYYESPTFKTIASPGAPSGKYTDAQLTKLITGNVLVVNEKRNFGIIVVKGLLTNGRQVNVQRTANKTVRDVKAICDKYIGLLNNEGARNALRQQVFAMLLQMQNDGALVPSVDGKDPAFKVDVYSTQADFANGIVRVDTAVRPVRAIDYIYARVLVQN